MRKATALILTFTILASLFSGCDLKRFANNLSGYIEIKLMIGRDKQWIFDEVQNILNQNNFRINGKQVIIVTDKAGSGEAMEMILRPDSSYVGWMPASSTYIHWANEEWYRRGKLKPRVNEEAETVFLTPTVIAMKESLAQLMGYPEKKIGWDDIFKLSVANDGWGIYGNNALNPVRFSHTHPAKSNSGLNSLIAEEYAFSNKTKGLTLDDIQRNSEKLKAVEQTVVYYGESTSLLQKKIVQTGPQFIQYAVLYEYMVADMNKKANGGEKIVAVYPKEGTIWGDVTFTEVYPDKISDEQKKALKEIRKILLSKTIQMKGMNDYFFRPANTDIALSASISTNYGVDSSEPKTTLEVPKVEVIDAILHDWMKNMKKRANVTFVIDTSASMNGEALNSVKSAMNGIITDERQKNDYTGVNDEDYISLLTFNNVVDDMLSVKGNKLEDMNSMISGLQAQGATRLYDAIMMAMDKNSKIEKYDRDKRIDMIIVLTDGMDIDSQTKYEQLIDYMDLHQGNLPVIFTVGYGNVDERILDTVAEKTGGRYYRGNPQTIKQIFDEIKTYF